jgi:hypothetical protein
MQRTCGSTACLSGLVLLIAVSAPLTGTTISLNSGSDSTGTTQWNSVRGAGVPNTVVTPNAAWNAPFGGAQWISFASTGARGIVINDAGTFRSPSGTPSASFYQSFTISSGPSSGGINVWSDDTAAVYIDSTLAFPVQLAGADIHCVHGAISCGANEGGYVSLAGLAAGTHVIRFDVWQLGGDSFGLLYSGQVTSAGDPPSVPEPATYALLAGGLLGIASYRRLRT